MLSTRRPVRSVLVLAMAVSVTGCSSGLLESKKIDYRSAQRVTPLEIPPDLTSVKADDRFQIPGADGQGVATFSTYSSERAAQPQQSQRSVLTSVDQMYIERAGSQRWLVVPGDADRLWLDLKDFWLELGFILNIERPEIGVMETDWAEDRAKIPQDFVRSALGLVLDGLFSTSERDKFRTRLEEGKEPGTVEIYISHRGMEEVYSSSAQDSTVWQPRAADPELEAEMLRRLMVKLGATAERADAVLANQGEQVDRAQLKTSSFGQHLDVSETFDRAWRRVGLALDRVGFTVEDRDRTSGVYFVRYIDPDVDARSGEKPGLLSRLAFWRDDEKGLAQGNQYRIRVISNGPNSQVSVLNKEGELDNSATANKILELLQKELR